tara:strand:+ start:627 stop:1415 length:789 start_codon:yes stop_codon:yes gene_type:complete
MKSVVLLVLALAVVAGADWSHDLTTDLTGSQVQMKDWSKGGEDSFSWEFDLTGVSVQKTPHHTWSWRYGIDYGQTQQGERGPRKTDDMLKVATAYRLNTGSWIKPYVSAGLRTQLTAGHRYSPKRRISDWFDPAYLNEAVGIGKGLTFGVAEVETRAGASFRHVLTRDFDNFSGGSSMSTDFGLESVTELDYKVSDTAQLGSKVKFFKTSGRSWVIRTDTALRIQLTKMIVLRAELAAFRDERSSDDWQLKQSTEIGIGWKL